MTHEPGNVLKSSGDHRARACGGRAPRSLPARARCTTEARWPRRCPGRLASETVRGRAGHAYHRTGLGAAGTRTENFPTKIPPVAAQLKKVRSVLELAAKFSDR